MRLLIYYHHFGGLGHGKRVYTMCKSLSKSKNKILVINSGTPQPELKISQYAKVINLPPITKAPNNNASIFQTNKELQAKTKIDRKNIIKLAIKNFNPKITIFEHYPFGRVFLDDEINKIIHEVKNSTFYGSIRDIVNQEIDIKRIESISSKLNGIFVHNNTLEIFDENCKKIDLPKSIKNKLIFTNKIISKNKEEIIPTKIIHKQLNLIEKKLFIVTIGGGIDGQDILEKIIDSNITNKYNCKLLISTGPTTPNNIYLNLKNKTKNNNNILITKFNPDLIDYISASDLVISMGGYNTISEILYTNSKALIYPRKTDSEQLIRIKKYQDQITIINNKISLEENIDIALKKQNSYNFKNSTFSKIIKTIGTINMVKIRITNRCNCNCDMCSWVKLPKKDMTLEAVKTAIIDAKKLNIQTINLTGGEPSLHPNFIEILDFIKQNNMKISLSTNFAIKFNKTTLNNIDYIDFSIDFIKNNDIEKSRLFPHLKDSIKNNIQQIEDKSKIHANITIRNDNINQINSIIQFLEQLKIGSTSIHLLETNKINNANQLKISKNEFIDFYTNTVPSILLSYQLPILIPPFLFKQNESIKNQIINKEKNYINAINKLQKLYYGEPILLPKSKCDNQALRVNIDTYASCCGTDFHDKTSTKTNSLIEYALIHNNQSQKEKKCQSCINNQYLMDTDFNIDTYTLSKQSNPITSGAQNTPFKETSRISIQLSNICNLATTHKKCPLYQSDQKTILPTSIFNKIIDSCKTHNYQGTIAFHTYNEPGIDPRLMLFIKHIKQELPNAKTFLLTNGFYLDSNLLSEFKTAGLDKIQISNYNDQNQFLNLKSDILEIENIKHDNRLNFYEKPTSTTKEIPACKAPLNDITVNCYGQVILCCMDWKNKHILGDLNKETIEDIIQKSTTQNLFKNLTKSIRENNLCKNCNRAR